MGAALTKPDSSAVKILIWRRLAYLVPVTLSMCFIFTVGRTNSSGEWRRLHSWEIKRACHGEEALVVLGSRKRSEMVIVTGGTLGMVAPYDYLTHSSTGQLFSAH